MSIYIRLEENKIFFRNTKTNSEYTITADKHFSYNGLLVANIDNAIDYIKIGIKQVYSRISFIKPKIYLLPMKNINEITQAEQYAILEAVYKAGARELIIIENENEIDKKLIKNKFGESRKIDDLNIEHINPNNFKGQVAEIIKTLIICILGLITIFAIRLIINIIW